MTQFTRLIQSSPNSNKGFTLIELIIAGVVSLVVISITMGLVVEQRRLFLGDQTKIDYNQNLRTASNFIGTDVKQTGERISSSSSLPVVRVISGASNTDPDVLILQRQLIEEQLPICADIATSDTSILIADNSIGCSFSDGDNDNLDDNLGQFKDYRCDINSGKTSCIRGENDASSAAITNEANCDNECTFGYIYDATNKRGEFFLYTDETFGVNAFGLPSSNRIHVIPLSSSNQFQYTYNNTDNVNIFVLEEKKYALCDGILQLVINRQPSYSDDCPYPDSEPKPIRLVEGLDNFQVRAQTNNGWVNDFNNNLSTITSLNDLESIEVTLNTVSNDLINTDNNQLELVTEFFPRNANSNF